MTTPWNRVSSTPADSRWKSNEMPSVADMRCEECGDKLDRFVDRELTNTEALEVQLHLEGCPDCMDHYEFQEHLKRVVKHSCDCDQAPKAFRDKLREILS